MVPSPGIEPGRGAGRGGPAWDGVESARYISQRNTTNHGSRVGDIVPTYLVRSHRNTTNHGSRAGNPTETRGHIMRPTYTYVGTQIFSSALRYPVPPKPIKNRSQNPLPTIISSMLATSVVEKKAFPRQISPAFLHQRRPHRHHAQPLTTSAHHSQPIEPPWPWR